jgi:hypothetical protein
MGIVQENLLLKIRLDASSAQDYSFKHGFDVKTCFAVDGCVLFDLAVLRAGSERN